MTFFLLLLFICIITIKQNIYKSYQEQPINCNYSIFKQFKMITGGRIVTVTHPRHWKLPA